MRQKQQYNKKIPKSQCESFRKRNVMRLPMIFMRNTVKLPVSKVRNDWLLLYNAQWIALDDIHFPVEYQHLNQYSAL